MGFFSWAVTRVDPSRVFKVFGSIARYPDKKPTTTTPPPGSEIFYETI